MQDEFVDLFISESQEILQQANTDLISLEKETSGVGADGAENLGHYINSLFRGFHTIKGMAMTLEYGAIADTAHELESILHSWRKGDHAPELKFIDFLFKGLDLLSQLVERVQKGKGVASESVRERILDLKSGLSGDESVDVKDGREVRCVLGQSEVTELVEGAGKEGNPLQRIRITLMSAAPLPVAVFTLVLTRLRELGEVPGAERYFEVFKKETLGGSFDFYLLTALPVERIEEALSDLGDIEEVAICNVDAGTDENAGEGSVSDHAHSVRVPLRQLDKLMNLLGEVVISRLRLSGVASKLRNKELDEAVAEFGRLTTEMQAEIMLTRLVPLNLVVHRYPRMVRDLARELGKDVRLKMDGVGIGVDRSVLDEINDPLVHILRNAVGHGIEGPGEREVAAKPAQGTVNLCATRDRNHVIVEISDDGRGLDPDRIRARAVDVGILSEEEAATLPREAVLDLVTHPSFSTTEEVTSLSGRGVGMNVVKTRLDALGGALLIESEKGRGTTFRLKLPLSLAIVQALLVRIAGEIYTIPLTHVAETIKVEAGRLRQMEHHCVVPYRGGILALEDLSERFCTGHTPGDGSEERKSEGAMINIVVIESGPKRLGLMVDAFVGQQEVVIKPLKGRLQGLRGMAGATILANGRVSMILDVNGYL